MLNLVFEYLFLFLGIFHFTVYKSNLNQSDVMKVS